MNQRILAIAKDVRNRCETFATSSKSRKYDFHNQYDLSCMCAVASFALNTALRRRGFKSRVAYGSFDNSGQHCWVEYRGCIIDITASQYGLDDIHIVKTTNRAYKRERAFTRLNHFFNDWERQKPDAKVSRYILSKKVLTSTK